MAVSRKLSQRQADKLDDAFVRIGKARSRAAALKVVAEFSDEELEMLSDYATANRDGRRSSAVLQTVSYVLNRR